MTYKFANRMDNIKASAIREIFKALADPTVISLGGGSPSSLAFPNEEIAKITEDIFKNEYLTALQYNISEGYPKLRQFMLEDMAKKGNAHDFDDLIITSGAQQAIELTAKVLVNKDDTIICENPSFLGSLNAFKSFECNLVGVDTDDDGVNIASLENALKANKNVKFIYLIPNFQNPMGVTMSFSKRKAVLRLAKEYNTLILEDNPYGELRFSGEDIPSIKSLDDEGHVIYAGSFSKILSPGLRVGYLLAPKPIIEKTVVAKQSADVHTTILSQLICYKFLTECNISEHLTKIRGIYKAKAELMLSEIDKKFDKRIKYTKPEGGLFIWCTLPTGVSMQEFCKEAIARKVAIVPGNAFLTDENLPSSSFRLNFSTPTDEQIVTAIDILSQIPID